MKSERMDTVEKDRKFEQQLESVRNLLESTKYTKSVVLKPKDEVIYDPSMFAQLAKEVRRFGAEWFSWSGVFVIPEREEPASPAKQESSHCETIETVERSREFDQMLDRIGNMVESTQYIKSILVKPKKEVISDPSMLIQLYNKVTRVGAVWFSWSGVFVVPEREESASPAKQESSQDETLTPVTEEHSSQSAEALLNDRINIELEKLQAHFRRKMSKSEVCESVAFLLSRGFKPEEIAAKVGVGRATVYRHILQEKTDNSVSQ
ncbi:MAG: hypothetical protein ABSB71_12925 [Candidatus Bathyarchaeia archaeon]